LINYLADHLYDEERANEIQAATVPIKLDWAEKFPQDVKEALQLSEMRRQMAKDTFARVIMGGKTHWKRSKSDKRGYAGRLPGPAEEARAHLALGKPVYILGGFGGCGAWVAAALSGELENLSTEENPELSASAAKGTRYYRDFC